MTSVDDIEEDELIEEDEEPDEDYGEELGDCPYWARWLGLPGHDPEAVCGYSCIDEPACMTYQPPDGWKNDPRRGQNGSWVLS